MTRIPAGRRAGGAATPTISVIVPVYNGEAVLAQCLLPLVAFRLDGEIAEVIVVDDGSTDSSAWIATEAGARVVPSGGRLGPGGARNRGAEVATGEVLWFVDADVVVHTDAARVLEDALARTGAAAVFGTYDEFPAATNFLSQYKNLSHRHHHVRSERAAETFWAGCGAVRADAFWSVGGFDAERYPEPSIEDVELGVRLRRRGHAIFIEPELQGQHLKAWHFANLLRTDIVQRAYPWTRLMQERPMRATLNVSMGERLRALLAWALALSVAVAMTGKGSFALAFALLAAAIAANAHLFALFLRTNGIVFALGAILFHQFAYLYASAAFVAFRLGWSPRRSPPPT
jgi:glycosyltransferase involved in cell wall biosynthesis